MKNKLSFIAAILTVSALSPALASTFVTESNLTGFQLPKGAIELTDDDFSDEMS